MRKHAAILSALILLATVAATAQEAAPTDAGPLAPFERVVGGRWYADDGSFNEFEWGVGKKVLRARSYWVADGEPHLVSEGMFFWHPEEQGIRGYVVAIDMPVELFEMETTFEGNTMTNRLRAHGEMGGEFREVFEFTDENHYTWTLYDDVEAGVTVMMGGKYERR